MKSNIFIPFLSKKKTKILSKMSSRMQKGPVHMLRQHWSKFKDGNARMRRLNRPQKWVHPRDRIERWKIFEGDIVKVMVGRAKNEVGKVKSVDKLSNRIW